MEIIILRGFIVRLAGGERAENCQDFFVMYIMQLTGGL